MSDFAVLMHWSLAFFREHFASALAPTTEDQVMKFRVKSALGVFVAVSTISLAAHAAPLTVDATDDLYNANSAVTGVTYDGGSPVAINVTGDSSVTIAASGSITLNGGGNFNDPDGIGSASDSGISAANEISGITAPNAGFLAGVFEGATLGATPSDLDYETTSSTSAASYAPELQQAFFVGDGLTGDGTGTMQTFYVPTGATELYLGITDAGGYHGTPGSYDDNSGSFSVTVGAVGGVAAAPEPSTWTLLIVGVGMAGAALRLGRRNGQAAATA